MQSDFRKAGASQSKHRYAPDHSASTGGRQTRYFPMWGDVYKRQVYEEINIQNTGGTDYAEQIIFKGSRYM